MRDMTAGVQAELPKGAVQPVFLVELEFDSGTTRVWNGYGVLSWNGHDWLGTGELGRIGDISETSDLRAETITLELSGIPATTIAVALGEPHQGRPARIYLGFVDDSAQVLPDPILLHEGRIDSMPVEDDGETATIRVVVESRLAMLERSRERRITDQDQRRDFPNDRAYEFVAGLQDKQIRWGP